MALQRRDLTREVFPSNGYTGLNMLTHVSLTILSSHQINNHQEYSTRVGEAIKLAKVLLQKVKEEIEQTPE